MLFKVRNTAGDWFLGSTKTTSNEKNATVYDSNSRKSMLELNTTFPNSQLTLKVVSR